MLTEVLKSKKYRVKVTHAELQNVGSIIISYGQLDFDRAKDRKPTILFPNSDNKLS